eukprot:2523006-Rhodomonas_salina.2
MVVWEEAILKRVVGSGPALSPYASATRSPGILLPGFYAMSGTELGYAATREGGGVCTGLQPRVAYTMGCMVLAKRMLLWDVWYWLSVCCYAMSGTCIECMLLSCDAISGTSLAYAAIRPCARRCPVLTSRMLLLASYNCGSTGEWVSPPIVLRRR